MSWMAPRSGARRERRIDGAIHDTLSSPEYGEEVLQPVLDLRVASNRTGDLCHSILPITFAQSMHRCQRLDQGPAGSRKCARLRLLLFLNLRGMDHALLGEKLQSHLFVLRPPP